MRRWQPRKRGARRLPLPPNGWRNCSPRSSGHRSHGSTTSRHGEAMNTAPQRLLLEGVTLVNQAGRSDIEVIGGRIAALTPSKTGNGGVVTPLLADAHVHLDKTYTVDRTKGRVEGLFDAIALVE